MSWVSGLREDEIVDLWPEHAEALIGAMEFHDENHKAIVMYLDREPLGSDVILVAYMSWKSPFTGRDWMKEIWRRDNLVWSKNGIGDPGEPSIGPPLAL